jgi:hypothetical protein
MSGYDVKIFEANGEKLILTSYPDIYILLLLSQNSYLSNLQVWNSLKHITGRPVSAQNDIGQGQLRTDWKHESAVTEIIFTTPNLEQHEPESPE